MLQEFREFVNPARKPKAFVDNELIPMGDAFDQIKNANFEAAARAEEINKYLLYLGRIDNFDW